MTTYYSIHYTTEEPNTRFCKDNRIFATRLQAETYLRKSMSPRYVDMYEVRHANWRVREQAMFVAEVYTEPVWRDENFWSDNYQTHQDHYVHVSLSDPRLLAFTENAERGEQDRQLQMKPGKYLQQFFGDVLTQKQITFYAEWWVTGERPLFDAEEDVDLKFASTPDEIVEVYQEGPSSCMQGDDSVQVYGAGDLAVAYLTYKNRGKIVARSLCWPEKKTFGRVYPNTDSWDEDGFESEYESRAAYDTLFSMLRKQGFTSIQERSDVFDGARLLAIPLEEDDDSISCSGFVMPYLDNCYRVTLSDEDNKFFIMSLGGGYASINTDGTLYIARPYDCPSCGKSQPANTSRIRPQYYTAGYGWQTVPVSETCCASCYHEHTFVDDYSGRTVSLRHDSVRRLNGVNCSNNWVTDQLNRFPNGYWTSDFSGELFNTSVVGVRMANGDFWTPSEFRNHGFTCYVTGDRYPLADMVVASDGTRWSKAAVELSNISPVPLQPNNRYWPTDFFSNADRQAQRYDDVPTDTQDAYKRWLISPPTFPSLLSQEA